jgi:hypothetical protein
MHDVFIVACLNLLVLADILLQEDPVGFGEFSASCKYCDI